LAANFNRYPSKVKNLQGALVASQIAFSKKNSASSTLWVGILRKLYSSESRILLHILKKIQKIMIIFFVQASQNL